MLPPQKRQDNPDYEEPGVAGPSGAGRGDGMEEPFPFEDLPPELRHNVLGYLGVKDILSARSVSKDMKKDVERAGIPSLTFDTRNLMELLNQPNRISHLPRVGYLKINIDPFRDGMRGSNGQTLNQNDYRQEHIKAIRLLLKNNPRKVNLSMTLDNPEKAPALIDFASQLKREFTNLGPINFRFVYEPTNPTPNAHDILFDKLKEVVDRFPDDDFSFRINSRPNNNPHNTDVIGEFVGTFLKRVSELTTKPLKEFTIASHVPSPDARFVPEAEPSRYTENPYGIFLNILELASLELYIPQKFTIINPLSCFNPENGLYEELSSSNKEDREAIRDMAIQIVKACYHSTAREVEVSCERAPNRDSFQLLTNNIRELIQRSYPYPKDRIVKKRVSIVGPDSTYSTIVGSRELTPQPNRNKPPIPRLAAGQSGNIGHRL